MLTCLALIRQDHKQMVQQNETKQKKLKDPLIADLKSKEEQKEDKEEKIELIEKKIIPKKEDKIEDLKREINEIRKNDEDVIKEYFIKWFNEMNVKDFALYNSDLPEYTKDRIEKYMKNKIL